MSYPFTAPATRPRAVRRCTSRKQDRQDGVEGGHNARPDQEPPLDRGPGRVGRWPGGQGQMMGRPGTPSLLREINDRAARELLLAEGPLTRSQVGEGTGLSKVTAAQTLTRLEERGPRQGARAPDNAVPRRALLRMGDGPAQFVAAGPGGTAGLPPGC